MLSENTLIPLLRDEASELKECFTRYSFQTISGSLITLSIVARLQSDYPHLGLVSALVILFIFAVLRIGLYKYYGANRIYGFELHLARMGNLREQTSGIPKERLTGISWEEAMRAWRIVQPTMFAAIYDVKREKKLMRFFPATPTLKTEFEGRKSLWFCVESLVDENTTVHTGSYLRTIFSTLYIIVFIALISVFFMCYQVHEENGIWDPVTWSTILFATLVTIGTWLRLKQFSKRRELLEDGMHSIHSCGISWHFVVVAHFRALHDLGAEKSDYVVDQLEGYSAKLSEQAKSLVPFLKHGESIYEWLRPSLTSNEL